jgi:hypothetical protein
MDCRASEDREKMWEIYNKGNKLKEKKDVLGEWKQCLELLNRELIQNAE